MLSFASGLGGGEIGRGVAALLGKATTRRNDPTEAQ
jgi:hypothetical protein